MLKTLIMQHARFNESTSHEDALKIAVKKKKYDTISMIRNETGINANES